MKFESFSTTTKTLLKKGFGENSQPVNVAPVAETNQQIILNPNEVETSEYKPRKFLWWIPLQHHCNPYQFFAFILAVFITLSLIVYMAATQSQIIYAILGVNVNLGDITGSLSLYSEIIAVFGVIIWSMLSDVIGRRTVMSVSIIIMGCMIIVYPYVKNVYPDMLLIKLVFSVGSSGATAMMVAMVMEVAYGKGGLASGCIGIASALGATFSALCLFLVPAELNKPYVGTNKGLSLSHAAIGGAGAGLGLLLFPFMPKDAYKRPPTNQFKTWFIKLYKGVKAGKDPRIALGYATSFFARADEIVITNFIALWVNQYYIEQGKCVVGAPCYYGLASSSSITGYAQLVALAATGFFSVASEYLPKEAAILVAGILGAVGNIPFAYNPDPTSKLALGFVILIACGEYGMIISGMAMVAGDHVRKEDNAAVSATYSFIGAIGIIVLSKLGGKLFDVWMKGAPFLLLGIGHAMVSVMSIGVYFWRKHEERKKKELDTSNVSENSIKDKEEVSNESFDSQEKEAVN